MSEPRFFGSEHWNAVFIHKNESEWFRFDRHFRKLIRIDRDPATFCSNEIGQQEFFNTIDPASVLAMTALLAEDE